MRPRNGALALLFLAFSLPAWCADLPKDVPANHWARKDVDAVLQRGVMDAPGGKFKGDAKVTRVDLARAMAGFGRSLEKRQWQPGTGKRFKLPVAESSPVAKSGVTRYELASAIAKFGSYAAAGLLKKSDKRVGTSVAIARMTSEPSKSDPAYASLQYLAKNRMVMPGSALLKPGNNPVTGTDVAQALAAVVTGAIDLNTDEPQNREEIERPPSQKGGSPSRAGAIRQ